MRIYIFCFRKTHRQTKKFPVANLFVRIYVFSLQTIKDRALCFSTKKSAVRVVFRHSHSRKQEYYFFGPTFLNTGTTIETLQQSGKQDSLRNILQNSASMYEGSRWPFFRIFRTTTGIQSEPDAFDESRYFMTFLTILGLIKILCTFRIVLAGKTCRHQDY